MKSQRGGVVVSKRRHQDLLRTRGAFAWTFLRDPNVHGLAIGFRRKDGELTRDLTLRFYVSKKRPIRHLAGHMIPPRLPLIQSDGTPHPKIHIGTDIHEVGRFRAAAAPRSGDLVVVGGEYGTAGLVFRNSVDGEGYFLTAGHVLDPGNSQMQQSIEVDSDPPVPGQHPVVLPLRRRDLSITSSSNNLDAAVCRVGLSPTVSIQTHDGQIVRGLEDPETTGSYQMFSRELKQIVPGSEPDVKAAIRLTDLPPDNDWAYLTDTMFLRIAAKQGDSGSLLYRELSDGSVVAVGMLVAISNNGHAVFHTMRAILAAFQRSKGLELRPWTAGDI